MRTILSFAVIGAMIATSACNYPAEPRVAAATPPTGENDIALRVVVASPVDTRTRAACADDFLRAVQRRGFVVVSGGKAVDVELWLTPDPMADMPSFADSGGPLAPGIDSSGRPRGGVASYVVEANGTMQHGSAPSRKVRAAGAGRAPCDAAGERFADALIASLTER